MEGQVLSGNKAFLRAERAKYITAVVLYGTIGVFLRFVALPSEFVAMCRGLIGGSFILLYLGAGHRKPDFPAIRRNLRWLLISGICLGLNWIFLFAAYMMTTVAIASLCNYLAPLIVVVISPFVLHERLELGKLPCVLAAFIGIILVSGVAGGEVGELSGVAMGLLAALCFVCIVFCNRKLRDINAMDRSIVQLLISSVTILPYVLLHNWGTFPAPDMRSVMIILLLGIVHTGVAYCLYFSGMATLPVQTVAILGYLEPVVSVLCSAFVLHEPMTPMGWVGAGMIIAAAAVSEALPAGNVGEM